MLPKTKQVSIYFFYLPTICSINPVICGYDNYSYVFLIYLKKEKEDNVLSSSRPQ